MKIQSKKQLLKLIKANDRYVWPGGYPVYIVQMGCLGIVCWDCAQKDRSVKVELVESFNDPLKSVHLEPLFEGEHWCECGKQLEVAYPED